MIRYARDVAITAGFLTLGCAIAAGAALRSDDWPQWRGPRRDGAVSAAGLKRLPRVWPGAAPAPAWKSFVGEGYSGPVVADGRVYIMGRENPNIETCVCFDAQTGTRLWRHAYPTTYESPDPRGGHWPKSTPTVDGDRVYMLGLGGLFTCLETRSGKVLWSHDFQKEAWGVEKDMDGVDKWFPPCGNAASAIVSGNEVIVPVGGKKIGAIAAFDRVSGKLLWNALPERSSYGSPLIAEVAGQKQLVGFTGLRMVGLSLDRHETLWEFAFPAMFEQTITTPVVYRDLVVVSGEMKPAIGLRVTREGEKVVQKEVWKNADLKTYLVTPVAVGDNLIGATGTGLVCLGLADGATKWISPKIPGVMSMVTAGDKVLATTRKGEMIVLAADPKEYRELARWKVSDAGETWSYPAIAGGKMYVKDKESLICFDLSGKG